MPAQPLLMLTGLHGLDVIRALKSKLPSEERLDEEMPVLSQLGCESGISRGVKPTDQERRRRLRAIAFTCRSWSDARKNALLARNDNHGQSVSGRSEYLFGRSVRARRLRRGRVNIEEFLIRHHRGD